MFRIQKNIKNLVNPVEKKLRRRRLSSNWKLETINQYQLRLKKDIR